LRNSFAHRLNFKLSAERVRSLYNCFDSEGKQIVQNAYDATRKQRLASKHPKKIWGLDPKDQFSLVAATMRVMLLLAHQQQTEGVDGKPPRRPRTDKRPEAASLGAVVSPKTHHRAQA
jgi:hypothetical protein